MMFLMDETPLGGFLEVFYRGLPYFQPKWIDMGPKRIKYCVFLGPKRVQKVQKGSNKFKGTKQGPKRIKNI